ncbi:DUF1653 domain-containing protein [Parachitinimonas caeni]|uniref:DUF1653 domain-containing protein n=1 Tax=Parachitinimonas caeni TaxID=3031301 RepID=A0ABT7DTR4_9NEIS|nr:DUF1653 domain-containing protein [Parachitinimonas caeni]MDK2123448.1 DUF1653 domain-containing protein [Parachitinimonas caeni]
MQYRHFKGGIYEFLHEARLESDPTITMIVYRASDGSVWTRPSSVFFELIEHNGQQVQRFTPIDPTTQAD